MINFDKFWADPDDEQDEEYGYDEFGGLPGVTLTEIHHWEQEHGVKMPATLRGALGRQNGGVVRYSSVQISRLDQILPVSDEVWEYGSYEEDEIPDRNLVFDFAQCGETGGQYFLNFNANGPEGEPSVYEYHSDPGDIGKVSGSPTKFLERLLAVSDAPKVDWSETTQPDLAVVARETIDVSPVYGSGAEFEQALVQDATQLILYTRLSSSDEETLTRHTLPLPLDVNFAPIQPHRPAPISTHSLVMQPQSFAGIVYLQSTRTKDNHWKNTTMRGAPICGSFESVNRAELHKLRAQLLGSESADRAREREEAQAALEKQLDSLSPDAQRAAILQGALRMHAEMQQMFGQQAGVGGTESPPPELAGLTHLIEERMADAVQRAQKHIAQHAPDSETQHQIAEMLKKMMPRRPEG
jgi:hypothetical protein